MTYPNHIMKAAKAAVARVHSCAEWDYLTVGPDDPEFENCTCFNYEARKVARLIMSAQARMAEIDVEKARLRAALQEIANGDGAYGAQAFEYKQIARKALEATNEK